jgi:formylglycine-generating enzyme required for sulfatase activity
VGTNPYVQAVNAAAATPPAVPASQASPRPASADPASEPVDAAPQKPSQGNAGLAFFLVFVGTLGFIGLLALFTDKSSNDDYAEYAEAATEAADAAAAADPAAMAGDAAADAAAAPADAVAPLYDTLPALLSVKGCSACSEMARIPEGSFLMGSPEDEADRDADEGPQHRVALSAFQIGRTEVTQAQWQAVMGENPSGNQSCGPACPVESVTVAQIDDFIARLNRLDPDWYYDLPTEAQWEYAARAATTTRYWWGNEPAPEVSGHDATDKATSGVDVFRDNAWGLYQVHGNVYEFTRDCYGSYPTHGAVTNGNVSISCDDSRPLRVVRGGAVANGLKTWRSAFRGAISPDTKVNSVGFRLMRRPREELKK